MTRKSYIVLCSFLLIYAVVVLSRMLIPESPLYTELLTAALVQVAGRFLRLGLLALALWYVRLSVRQFEADNPVRPAWLIMQWGLLFYLLGQLTLNILNWVLPSVPFPSFADAPFMVAMLLLPIALIVFVRGYLRASLITEDRGKLIAIAAVATIVLSVFYGILLRPLLSSEAPLLAVVVNIGYQAADLVLVVAATVLLKITMSFRGGRIWEVWILFLGGFLSLFVGDALYSYFSTFNLEYLYPIIDVAYTWSYLLWLCAAVLNFRLTKPATTA
jgi:hypothetical protein